MGPRSTQVWRVAMAAGVVVAAIGCGSEGEASTDRQEEVAERGAEVMPFDLDATTHRFTDTETGGVQDVVADDPADDEQVALVRRHLEEEAARFSHGDFDDPAAIHGHDMPGLEVLQERHAEIEVSYVEIEAGARLIYTTEEDELVSALHDWFAAQVHDHGDHAEAG